MTTTTTYALSIDHADDNSMKITIGLWDADRYTDSLTPVGTPMGGFAFGMDAELTMHQAFGQRGTWEIRVQQAAIGSHTSDVARQRIRVYTIAADLADKLTEHTSGREYTPTLLARWLRVDEAFLASLGVQLADNLQNN